MKKSNYVRTLYATYCDNLISQHNMVNITQDFDLNITTCHIEQLFQHKSDDKHKIVMFDYQDRQHLIPYMSQSHQFNMAVETIVINVPHRIHTEKLLELGNLKGVFYRQDSTEQIRLGLSEIQKGQNWLPRHVTSQLIHYYRHLFRNQALKAAIDLTSREIQILRSLQTGASNMQMAETLFISEFTVKSHLYQIFKKLAVKNRTQAISWANNNLVS
ncbi:LuxR C-terminal-related transcriptional regulator [Vibrio sp. RC27]